MRKPSRSSEREHDCDKQAANSHLNVVEMHLRINHGLPDVYDALGFLIVIPVTKFEAYTTSSCPAQSAVDCKTGRSSGLSASPCCFVRSLLRGGSQARNKPDHEYEATLGLNPQRLTPGSFASLAHSLCNSCQRGAARAVPTWSQSSVPLHSLPRALTW
jgi:hypothetical protein